MFLVLFGAASLLAAGLLHAIHWTARQRYPELSVTAGAPGAIALTGFCLLFLTSDIRSAMLVVLGIFWAVALLLGLLHAHALQEPWWRGIAGVFFGMALAFLAAQGSTWSCRSHSLV